MSLVRERISENLKEAMRAKDEIRVSTLRMLKTEIVKLETEKGKTELDEAGLIKLLSTMKKQREESIEQYEKAGRQELADQEKQEIAIIETFLPQPLSTEELSQMVKDAIAESGVASMKEMGKVMKIATAKAAGRANGKVISAEVRAQLAG